MESINLSEINWTFAKSVDKFRRMHLGASNYAESIDENEVVLRTILDNRFFPQFPRTIEAYCYELAKDFISYSPISPLNYKVALFYSQGASGAILSTQSEMVQRQLDEMKIFTDFHEQFLDVISGTFVKAVVEESDIDNKFKFEVHPKLRPWTDRIGFHL